MKTWVVKYSSMPTYYSAKQALVVEAEDELTAVLVVADHLLRRGFDPRGFCPMSEVFRHLDYIGRDVSRVPHLWTQETWDANAREKAADAAREACTLYTAPPAGRVIGTY